MIGPGGNGGSGSDGNGAMDDDDVDMVDTTDTDDVDGVDMDDEAATSGCDFGNVPVSASGDDSGSLCDCESASGAGVGRDDVADGGITAGRVLKLKSEDDEDGYAYDDDGNNDGEVNGGGLFSDDDNGSNDVVGPGCGTNPGNDAGTGNCDFEVVLSS